MIRELRRIAYVEDEPDIRELTELILSSIGDFEVEVYASGAEALDRLGNFDPDLILLDVMMPDMNGPELRRRLATVEGLAEKPVVFMTAKTRREEVKRLLELGAIGVISKPFDPLSLSDELHTLWQEAA